MTRATIPLPTLANDAEVQIYEDGHVKFVWNPPGLHTHCKEADFFFSMSRDSWEKVHRAIEAVQDVMELI